MTSAKPIVQEDREASDDDKAIIEAGYQPRLSRSLGFFSSFAISFSYMSILTGIFANYKYESIEG